MKCTDMPRMLAWLKLHYKNAMQLNPLESYGQVITPLKGCAPLFQNSFPTQLSIKFNNLTSLATFLIN